MTRAELEQVVARALCCGKQCCSPEGCIARDGAFETDIEDILAALDAAGALATQKHTLITDGPACPTCGFRRVSRKAEPFIIEAESQP